MTDRGCPFVPVELPACSSKAKASAQSVSAAVARLGTPSTKEAVHAKRMHRVVVFGELVVRPMQTLLDCGQACCNQASGDITVRDASAELRLVDIDQPEAFRCFGDDSRVCCGFDLVRDLVRDSAPFTDATVAVEGSLVSGDAGPELREPRLCHAHFSRDSTP